MDMKKIRAMWQSQKDSCKNRTDTSGNPIEFRLSFDEWFAIWQASGKLEQRGRCVGQYCMSRVNDTGHYEVGNVFIQQHSNNIRQGLTGKTRVFTAEHCAKIAASHALNPRSGPNPGIPRTAEVKAKISATKKANVEKRRQENKCQL